MKKEKNRAFWRVGIMIFAALLPFGIIAVAAVLRSSGLDFHAAHDWIVPIFIALSVVGYFLISVSEYTKRTSPMLQYIGASLGWTLLVTLFGALYFILA